MRPPLHRRSLLHACPARVATPRPPRASPPSSTPADAARRAFALVDTLMADVAREVWVDTAVDDIVARQTAAEPGDDASNPPATAAAIEAAAVARVAASVASTADAALLAALGVAADAAAEAGDDVSAARLAALRAALLDAAAEALPPEARVLDAVVRVDSPRDREALVAEAVGCGAGSDRPAAPALPRVSAASLYTAACQLIDDLESHQVVPDGRLLRRLVLAREDVRSAADCGRLASEDDADALAEAVAAHGAALHSGAAQVAREVVAAASAEARRELVAAALRGDAEAAATPEGKPTPGLAANLSPRPGRVLTALAALAAGLRSAGESERAEVLAAARADAVALLTEAAY